VCARDLRTVRLLAALAAVSIETLDGFEAAERRAFTDELTGVTNRRGFEAQLAAALDRSDRFGESVAVVMCDVDEFKALNDAHGHEAGDLVLRSVAATLKRGVRAVDCCARYGGEEFVLVLPQATGAGAAELAERLRRAIEMRPVRADGRQLRVSASFGVAVYPTPVTTRGDLVAAADRALYRAKRDGRNCVRSE
jgi:diguanylate cyclase (GGDEF)-like protein